MTEVLLVDDNLVTRDTLTILLEQEGFAVKSCDHGKSALDLAKNRDFKIYVIDYRMPEMKGDAVTTELRKLHPDSFIIGYSIEPKEQAFLSAGADKFIIKDQLVKELVKAIKKKR